MLLLQVLMLTFRASLEGVQKCTICNRGVYLFTYLLAYCVCLFDGLWSSSRASLEGLGLFLVALTVGLLVFSSALYYAELDQPASQIHSAVTTWAIITDWLIDWSIDAGHRSTASRTRSGGPLSRWQRWVTETWCRTARSASWLEPPAQSAACWLWPFRYRTLAIPVPIITGHFNRFYAHKTGRGRNI